MYNYRRRRGTTIDRDEAHCPQNRSRNSRYENNSTTQSNYFLIYALSSSSPLDSFDS